MKRKFKAMLIASFVCVGLSSCHFGRSAEEMMNEYNDVERDLQFVLSSSNPDGSTSRASLADNQLLGLTSNWTSGDQLAIFDFGNVFYDGEDESNGSPLVPNLLYDKADDEDPTDDIDYGIFKGTIHSKMGEKTANSKEFAFVYPYKNFSLCYSDETQVDLDFNGQDGSLGLLAFQYQYAWGYAKGVCEGGVVTFEDAIKNCNTDWHAHGGDCIILDNKMAIIRFSVLYQQTDEDGVYQGQPYSLSQFLRESDLKVHHIEIENLDDEYGFTSAKLLLASGNVLPDGSASNIMQLSSTEGYLTLSEITKENAIEGAKGVLCWGTTFYIAVACPNNATLALHPMVKIYTCDAKTNSVTDQVFYGILSTHIIKEGNYYMSSPIITVNSKAHLVESAKLFLYYHSSFVWDPTTIE